MFIFLKVSVLLVLISETLCDCILTENKVNCSSLADVARHGNEKWRKLHITMTQIKSETQINKTTFSSTPNLEDIRITGNVTNIEDGAFDSLHRLRLLMLHNNEIEEIRKDTFGNISADLVLLSHTRIKTLAAECFSSFKSLRRLKIIKSSLENINANIFNNLSIQILTVAYSNVNVIEDNALADMQSLQELNLSGNKLKEFDSKRILGTNSALIYLDLSKNLLSEINKNTFQVLPSLKHILLRRNRIVEIEDKSFNEVKNLRSLYLSSNRVEVIHPNIFPLEGMQNLSDFRIGRNKLTYLSPVVLQKLPSVKVFCMLNNPWVCPCFDELVNWRTKQNAQCPQEDGMYPKGSRPVCIVLNKDKLECVYSMDYSKEVKELMKTYINELSKYEDSDENPQ